MRLKGRRTPNDGRVPEARRPWAESLHVWVVASFAVAQPLYDLLGKQAEFFVFQNAGRAEILGLVVVLSGLAPLVLVAAVRLAGLVGPRTGRRVHETILAVGVALTVLPALRSVEVVPSIALVYAALVLGAGVAVLYARLGAVRLFFTLLAPGVIVFPGLFVAASPVTPLLADHGQAPEGESRTIARPAPIVFVIFDELPTTSLMDGEERIDAGRYPGFAALAGRATWYRRATTVAESTFDAVPAILTGRYPRPGQLPHTIDHPDNLFTLLAGTYEMHAAGPATQLCPQGLCARDEDGSAPERLFGKLSDLAIVYLHLVLSADLRELLPSVTRGWAGFAGEVEALPGRREKLKHASLRMPSQSSRWETGLRFIEGVRAAPRPTLHYLHLMLPHQKFEYLPSGRTYRGGWILGVTGERLDELRHAEDPENVRQAYQRHLLQVGAVDTWLGLLLAHLEEIGIWDRALVVVTADHGIAFRAGEPLRGATASTFQDILPVPLFIKAPGQREGRIDDRAIEVVDILPIVTELIGTGVPWAVDGRSTRMPPRREAARLHRLPDLEPVSFTGVAGAMAAAARRRDTLLGSGNWHPSLWRRGPWGALVGAEVEVGAVEGRAHVQVRLDEPCALADVDPASGFVPVHITGEVTGRGNDEAPTVLAIAVNGRIEAVTQTWKVPLHGREGHWSAIVPEEALREGSNTLEVLVVTRVGTQTRLAPVRGIPRDACGR